MAGFVGYVVVFAAGAIGGGLLARKAIVGKFIGTVGDEAEKAFAAAKALAKKL